MDEGGKDPRTRLNRTAIRVLGIVIITSIIGIIILSFWGLTLRYGLVGAEDATGNTVADEALSILGNIGAAAVGGLVGWLARDYIETARLPSVNENPQLMDQEGPDTDVL